MPQGNADQPSNRLSVRFTPRKDASVAGLGTTPPHKMPATPGAPRFQSRDRSRRMRARRQRLLVRLPGEHSDAMARPLSAYIRGGSVRACRLPPLGYREVAHFQRGRRQQAARSSAGPPYQMDARVKQCTPVHPRCYVGRTSADTADRRAARCRRGEARFRKARVCSKSGTGGGTRTLTSH